MSTLRYIPALQVELARQQDLELAPQVFLVSSMYVEDCAGHDLVRLFNRGELAGEMRMHPGDGGRLASQLGLLLDDTSCIDVLVAIHEKRR